MTDTFLYVLLEPAGYDDRTYGPKRHGRLARLPVAGGTVELLADDLADPCALTTDGTTTVWREARAPKLDAATKTWIDAPGGIRALSVSGGKSSTIFEGDADCEASIDGASVVFVAHKGDGVALARVALTGGEVAYAGSDPGGLGLQAEEMQREILKALGSSTASVPPPTPYKPYDEIFDLESHDGKLSYIGQWHAPGPSFIIQAALRPAFETMGKPIGSIAEPWAMAADSASVYVLTVSHAGATGHGGLSRVSRDRGIATTLLDEIPLLGGATKGHSDFAKLRARQGTVVWSDATYSEGGALWIYKP